MSADDAFLKRNWPRIKKALEYSIQQDGNDDGLIENSQHNTYDINFFGANTFVGCALPGRPARGRGDGPRDGRQRVRRAVQRDLRSGPQARPRSGCGTASTSSRRWISQKHPSTSTARVPVRSAVRPGLGAPGRAWATSTRGTRCARRSSRSGSTTGRPTSGRRTTSHPPERWFASPTARRACSSARGRKSSIPGPSGVLYRDEVWTGIEYQVASHMIWEGMVDEALAICRAVHDRYHPSKRNPYNEVECGDHYARAMASWGVLLALSGYRVSSVRGAARFCAARQRPRFPLRVHLGRGVGLI